MEDKQIYDQLAAHLDQGIVGSPKSPALMGILAILFPLEEARVAAKLPLVDATLSEIEEMFPEQRDGLEAILDRMVERGTVFALRNPNEERRFRLLPSVVGWAETPFWAGRQNDQTRALSPLWLKYRDEAFAGELARGIPPVRVIPITETLPNASEVIPYDDIEPLVRQQSYHAVGHCPCRLMKKSVGEGCDHSLQNCLHFGEMGRFMVERGMAREITADETMKILRQSHEEGLVHNIDNVDAGGQISTICNCCGCCCIFLASKKSLGLQTFSRSNYRADMDQEMCVACSNCEDRCPMHAVAVDDTAVVDETICIGCGVCIPTCTSGAAHLVQRADAKPPPDLGEFFSARFKTAD